MSLPKPPIDLVNHCSTVWNNTLYVYSPQGLQSLPLEQGADWQTLDGGQSVTGGLCVPSDEALYIVGGTPDAAAVLSGYSGLQRYHFDSETWETLTPASTITQNRVKHGAAFINAINSIVVYSGTQDAAESGLSTQTFLLNTVAPYDVLSFNSQGAPALTSPMVMPWDNDRVVLIGGAADNTQVWLFGQIPGWTNLGTSLPAGLGLDSPTKQCTIVTGDDGSKVLEIYDLGASPNAVTRYALFVNGGPAPVGQVVGPPSSSSRKRRRDLTVANWPSYNSSLAPSTTRSGFSLAEDSNGLAIISGGNSNDPLAMFDQAANSWLNSTKFFVKEQIPLVTSTSSRPASSTASPTSTTSSAPTASTSSSSGVLGTGQSKSRVLTTLGATLGAIFGLAAILIIILLLLRWKKQKQRQVTEGGGRSEKENRLSFADQGADFMQEAGGARGRAYSSSPSVNSSLTSLQIFNNHKGSKPHGHRRGMPSDSSQVPLTKNKSPLGMTDPVELAQMSQRSSPTFTGKSIDFEKDPISPPKTTELTPAAALATKGGKDERSRSNGWSRYFTNNDVTNLASLQAGGRNTYETQVSDMSRSDYNDGRKDSHGSTVRPLELNLGPKFEGQRLSAVATGSPTMGQSHEHIQQGLQAEVRRTSASSGGSYTGYEPFSTGPSIATSTWTTPQSRNPPAERKADTRSISSAYSASNPFFGSTSELDPRPRKGSSGAPALPSPKFRNYGDVSRDSHGSAVTVFPSGLDSPRGNAFSSKMNAPHATRGKEGPDYGFPLPKAYFGNQRDSTASNVTVFPGAPAPTPESNLGTPSKVRPPESRNGASGRKNTAGEDLGWLNLKAGTAI